MRCYPAGKNVVLIEDEYYLIKDLHQGSSVLGLVAGFGVFFVFYALGAMGGGDVKLMAGFGAVLGWSRIWEASLWTAAVGGLIALAAILVSLLRRKKREKGSGSDAIPYAPAIALGSWLALIAH